MSKKTVVIIVAILVLGAGSLLFLNAYKLQLIHSVVVNAIIQKAPPDYPAEKIRETFNRVLLESGQNEEESAYLRRLLKLSQRLEKIQTLSAAEIDQLLLDLTEERN